MTDQIANAGTTIDLVNDAWVLQCTRAGEVLESILVSNAIKSPLKVCESITFVPGTGGNRQLAWRCDAGEKIGYLSTDPYWKMLLLLDEKVVDETPLVHSLEMHERWAKAFKGIDAIVVGRGTSVNFSTFIGYMEKYPWGSMYLSYRIGTLDENGYLENEVEGENLLETIESFIYLRSC